MRTGIISRTEIRDERGDGERRSAMSKIVRIRQNIEATVSIRTAQLVFEERLDRFNARVRVNATQMRFAERAGFALGLAYAMRDRDEPMRDVRAQLREAKAFVAAARCGV